MPNAIENSGSDQAARTRVAALTVLCLSALFLLSFDPFNRPVLLDPATWDYMSVEVAKGLVPYRDIFLHKTPGGAFIGAAGAWLADLFGREPVFGAHAVYLLLGAAAPALLLRLLAPSVGLVGATVAALFLLSIEQWPTAALEGVRPKVATVAFGLASLIASRERRYLLSGALGGVAVLCWQPALCFLLAATVDGLRDNAGRARAVGRLVLGSWIPTALLLAWFAAHGALGDLFQQAVLFNVDYMDNRHRSVVATARKLYSLFSRWNDVEVALILPALAGLVAAKRRLPSNLVVATAIYLLMCFSSFQAWPDMILFLPFLAAVLGAGLTGIMPHRTGAVLAACIAVTLAVTPAMPRIRTPVSWNEQALAMKTLMRGVARTDTIIAISIPEILIHSGRRNGWRWPYLWFGVDGFASAHTEGGFAGILRDLERIDPAKIFITRRWNGPLRKRFEAWAAERYVRTTARAFPHNEIRVYTRKRAAKRARTQ